MTDAAAAAPAGAPWIVPDTPSGAGATEWRPADLGGYALPGGHLGAAPALDPTGPDLVAGERAAQRVAARRRRSPLRLPVPLRPMTFTDILDGSFSFLKARAATVVGLALVVVVPLEVAVTLVQRDPGSGLNPILGPLLFREASDDTDWAAATIGWALMSLALLFLGACLSRLASAWYADGELTAPEVLSEIWARTPALLGVWTIALAVRGVGLATCGVVTVLASVLFVMIGPVIGAEALGPVAAVRRSTELARRRFIPVAGAMLGVAVVETIFQVALTGIPWMVADAFLPDEAAVWVVAIAAGAARLLTATASAGAAVLLYLDARVRAEGLDLQLSAAASGGSGR